MNDQTPHFPRQLLEFFKRNRTADSLEKALPLFEDLYANLIGGHSSLPVDPSTEEISVLHDASLLGNDTQDRPLVLTAEGDLYFRRYFQYEDSLARRLIELSREPATKHAQVHQFMEEWLAQAPDQLEAAKLALHNKLAVITGGPGTGKTYLLVAILAGLLKQDPNLSIALAAPTGKAAQRMTESIQANLEHFGLSEEEKENFPQLASTIHRLLRPLPPSIHFRRNASSPLNADFVIIDEASMVDLPLMSKLIDAIKPTSRLLLIGDVDQLAPVEAGAPLASIVRHFERPEQPDLVAKLSTNRRFGSDSTIHSLCQAIAKGDEKRARELIGQGPKEDFEHSEKGLSDEADEIIRKGYAPLAEARTPEEAHEAFLSFQILCPTHEGETGVNPNNERVQKILGITKREKDQSGRYAGMPIIIEKNDYGVELYNGDIGVFLPEEKNPEQLTAWFMKSNGTFRSVSPARLPPNSPAYAMTVHRSQGSEYEEVMVLLPSKHSEILTRHLLYVACSRAKKKVRLFGPAKIIEETVKQDTPPSFGMEHRLQNA